MHKSASAPLFHFFHRQLLIDRKIIIPP
jgi:hypothetical protein